ncbi:unnamed protein product, partial [Polarella glacialis]
MSDLELARLRQVLAQSAARCPSASALRRAVAELRGGANGEGDGSEDVAGGFCTGEEAEDAEFEGGAGSAHAIARGAGGSGGGGSGGGEVSTEQALRQLRAAPGVLGLDIGGTLAKLALMQAADEPFLFPANFGETGQYHADLSFQLRIDGLWQEVRFLSGSTSLLERVLHRLEDAASPQGDPSKSGAKARRVVASGGGAHRLASLLLHAMKVEVVPFKEMESLVSGLTFLHAYGPEDEVFEVVGCGEQRQVEWPSPLFPCIMVNIGSGVSILRVDGGSEDPMHGTRTFTRLGGTPTGGGTFLGLARLLTSAKTFKEALELAQRGDAARVNKLVSDIYGRDGSQNLGLPAGLTAVHFGKLVNPDTLSDFEEADVAAALLVMVTQASAVLARAFAQGVAGSQPSSNSQPGTASAEKSSKHICRSRSMPLDALNSPSAGSVLRAQLLGPAAYPGHRRTPVFFVGGFLAENPKSWDILSRAFLHM